MIAGVLGMCALCRLGAAGRRRAVALAVVLFAFVTRFQPSVLRAGAMALLLVLASVRGVPRDARHGLAGTVLVLLLCDPLLAGSLGLLLSATATVGVLVIAPMVADRLPQRLPRRLAEVIGITVGAQVAVVPLLLATFGTVPLAALPANVLAAPAAALAVALAFAGTAVALVHVEAGALVFLLAGLPARLVLAVAHTLEGRGGVVDLAQPVAVAALLGGCLWLLVRRGTRTARVLLVGTTLLALLSVGAGLAPRLPAPGGFAVTAIDVGQGDAFLI
jgi:competence protein ComEC